jgi:hypothetical protein
MRPRILRELCVHRHCSLNADSAFFRRYRCIRRLNLAPVAACRRLHGGLGSVPAGPQAIRLHRPGRRRLRSLGELTP